MSHNNRHIPRFHVPIKPLFTTLFVVAALVVFVVLAFSDSTKNTQVPVVSSERTDWDSDGLSNKQEAELGTNPNSTDTDGDGFSDWEEVKTGHSPLISSKSSGTHEENVSEKLEAKSPLPPADDLAIEHVEWSHYPYKLSYNGYENGKLIEGDSSSTGVSMYPVGIVKDGPYLGFSVLLFVAEGMGTSYDHLLAHPATSTPGSSFDYAYRVLTKEMEQYLGQERSQYDIRVTFNDLEMPDTIPVPNSSITLVKHSDAAFDILTNGRKRSLAFVYKGMPIYISDDRGCLFIEREDFTATTYRFKTDFIREDGLVNVAFNDGTKNANQYDYINMTCGGGCIPYRFINQAGRGAFLYKTEIQPDKDVIVAGRTPQGQLFYQFKNSEHPALKEAYDQYKGWYTGSNSQYNQDKSEEADQLPYQAFINSRPVLFWKDPFGRWIEFDNKIYVPPAEMCKPVVYLYPEHETDVNVKVAPTGGMSVSDPVYPEGGWKVRAKPSGELFDLRDGKLYSSLFWEGQALHFETPKEGFVVERGELSKFFRWSLGAQGLNEKETAEFMSYWIPRMREFPFYFVTYLSSAEVDRYAPLTIEPNPTSVIRVFMSAHGLLAPHSFDPLEFETPKRTGFTVVEWGGTLR